MLIINGFFNPYICAVLGLFWIIGRVFYTEGYIRGGPEGRIFGAKVSGIALMCLLILTLYRGIAFIFEL